SSCCLVPLQVYLSCKHSRRKRIGVQSAFIFATLPIGQPGDLVSQDYPFVHPSKPLVAYNCLKHHFSVDAQGEERHSADWDSLNLYSLESEAEVESKPRVPVTKPPEVVSEAGIVYVVGDVHAPTGVVMEDTGPITVLKA